MTVPSNPQHYTPRIVRTLRKSKSLDELSERQIKDLPHTPELLAELRVRELRVVARDVVGSGSWIAHASKDELIDGILTGEQPKSTGRRDQGSVRNRALIDRYGEEHPDEAVAMPDRVDEAEIIDTARDVARYEIQQVAKQFAEQLARMRNVLGRIVGPDTVDDLMDSESVPENSDKGTPTGMQETAHTKDVQEALDMLDEAVERSEDSLPHLSV